MARKKIPIEKDKMLRGKAEMFELMTEHIEDVQMPVYLKKDIKEKLFQCSEESKVSQNRIINMSLVYYLSMEGFWV